MGLTAHLYRIKGDLTITYNSEGQKASDLEKKAVEIAYFINNWEFHNFVDNDSYIVPLTLDTLERAKDKAKWDEVFNKDYGDGQSVLSVIDDAIIYAKYGGYTIFYTASY